MNFKLRFQLSTMMFFEYFIWGIWFVTMGTYLGTTLKFDGLEIGLAYGAVAVAAMVSPLFVGMVADKFFATEKILGLLHLVGGVLLYVLTTVSEFNYFYPILLIYSFCYMATIALTSSISFVQMENPGSDFPKIRVLGTIGWIAAGLLIGAIGLEQSNNLVFTFQLAAAASVVLGLYCFTLPHTPPANKGKKVKVGDLLGLDALVMLKNRSFLVLLIASTLISIPLAFYHNFTNLFLNETGMTNAASKMTIGQMSEIGFMLVMPFFFRRLGVKKMMLLGMGAWFIRYTLFGFGDNDSLVWMLYLGIALHGVCYDFFFVTGQIYADNKAPEGLKNSAQGLMTFATYGVGMFLGSYISGKVVEMYTVGEVHNWMEIYRIPAIAAAAVFVLFALLFKDDLKSEDVEKI